MKAIILAAWYATRLYPLTENFPKPLLEVWNKKMLDHIMEKLEEIDVSEVYLVTNNKFTEHFQIWANNYNWECKNIKIINDNTTSNEDRLWAIWDIQYVIEKTWLNEDFLVIGWDNLFKFSLKEAKKYFLDKKKPTIIAHDLKDYSMASKYWIISINEKNEIIDFEEKPQNPKSTLCAICVYFYNKEIIPMIKQYLDEWNNKDAPWNLPVWLIKKDIVYWIPFDEEWFDIWSFESLEEANKSFS